MAMRLSKDERASLRRLDADLDRQDPRLAWQLSAFIVVEDHVQVSWRPPRVWVAVAAFMVAGVVFLVAAMTLLMRAPCRGMSAHSENRVVGGTASPAWHPAADPSSARARPSSPVAAC
jgi:hypothetical protein